MTKSYNENYIREAAYYNWQNAGCPSGKDEYFWNMAISQLYGNCSTSCGCSKSSTKTTSKKSSSAKSSTVKSSTGKKSTSKK